MGGTATAAPGRVKRDTHHTIGSQGAWGDAYLSRPLNKCCEERDHGGGYKGGTRASLSRKTMGMSLWPRMVEQALT